MTLRRRTVLRGLGAAGLLAALPSCSAPLADVRLTIATAGNRGVYYALGTALAEAWRDGLGLAVAPTVIPTGGSVENLQRLAAGTADVVFSQVDVAKEYAAVGVDAPRAPRALARIYDEYVHIVVPSASPITTPAQLRGARVSVGARNSGIYFTVQRLLSAIGLSPETDLRASYLSVDASTAALQRGEIDAFFWIGALPTPQVTALASPSFPIRLLDLEDVAGQVRAMYKEYAEGTVPAGTYSIAAPITTLLVRNFLLVAAGMADDLAYSLVDVLFRYQPQLARRNVAALTIDLRAAIGTQPVPLHPGAERYFRAAKNA